MTTSTSGAPCAIVTSTSVGSDKTIGAVTLVLASGSKGATGSTGTGHRAACANPPTPTDSNWIGLLLFLFQRSETGRTEVRVTASYAPTTSRRRE